MVTPIVCINPRWLRRSRECSYAKYVLAASHPWLSPLLVRYDALLSHKLIPNVDGIDSNAVNNPYKTPVVMYM